MKIITFVSLFLFPLLISAQELVTLTSAIAKPSQTNARVDQIHINVINKSIEIRFVGNNGEAGSAVYSTPANLNNCSPQVLQPTGAVLLNTLNNANLSTTSLVRRVLTRLQTDCYIPAGTISGTPE